MLAIMESKKGFTLVEIMIVVAIIGLLAAIAIPNLIRARQRARDSVMKANLHTVMTAAHDFIDETGSQPGSIGALSDQLDADMVSGTKDNVTYAFVGSTGGTFTVTATPPTGSGAHSYTIDQGGRIVEST